MLRAISAAILAAIGATSPSVASYKVAESAYELASYCRQMKDRLPRHANGKSMAIRYFMDGQCVGAIDGITEIAQIDRFSFDARFGICMPEITRGQIVSVFLKYVDDHPERGHDLYGIVLFQSLQQAFPCTPETKK